MKMFPIGTHGRPQGGGSQPPTAAKGWPPLARCCSLALSLSLSLSLTLWQLFSVLFVLFLFCTKIWWNNVGAERGKQEDDDDERVENERRPQATKKRMAAANNNNNNNNNNYYYYYYYYYYYKSSSNNRKCNKSFFKSKD